MTKEELINQLSGIEDDSGSSFPAIPSYDWINPDDVSPSLVPKVDVENSLLADQGAGDPAGVWEASGLSPFADYDYILKKQQEAADLAFERQQALNQASMDWYSKEAEKARMWQIESRRNTYRDLLYSLKSAGLNPVLAFMQAGSFTTPTASSGVVSGGGPGVAPKAEVSTENVAKETLELIVNTASDLITGILGLAGKALIAGAM